MVDQGKTLGTPWPVGHPLPYAYGWPMVGPPARLPGKSTSMPYLPKVDIEVTDLHKANTCLF
jgi:hypothetical protein